MSVTNNSTPADSKRRIWIAGGIAAAIVAAVLLVATISLRRAVSPNECFRLEQLKNLSVARLENSRFEQKRASEAGDLALADAGFAELAEKFPHDPLGARNLAVARLLELESKMISGDRAMQAVEQMLQLEDRSAEAHWLAGRIALEAGDKPRAVAELVKAAELAPENASLWHAISRLWIDSKDEAEKKRGYEALGRAFQAEPANLFLQAAWLKSQTQAQDTQALETLLAVRKSLLRYPALAERLQTRGGLADPAAAVELAQRAVENGEWEDSHDILNLANAILADPQALDDLRRIDRNPRTFVRLDFREPCDDKSPSAEAPPLEIKFSELPPQSQLPPLLGVTDFELADMDLDGRLEVVVLRETAVEIYSRTGVGDDWRLVAGSELPAGFTGMLPALLDGADLDAAAGPAGVRRRRDLDLMIYGKPGVEIVCSEDGPDGAERRLAVKETSELSKLAAVTAAAALDFDHDGDLDLVVSGAGGTTCWSNRGDFRFDDVSSRSQLPPASFRATTIEPVDWNRDGLLDLLLVGPSGEPPGWLENRGHGEFRWKSFEEGFASLRGANSVRAFDADGKGSWALAAASEQGLYVVRTDPAPAGPPLERSAAGLANSPRSQIQVWDYDNDGNLDLLSRSETTLDVYRGGLNDFFPAAQSLTRAAKPIRSVRPGDLDGDGDLDLAVAEADRIVLYGNEGGNQNQWLVVELVARRAPGRDRPAHVNSYGIGSLIELRAGPWTRRQVVRQGAVHFGLGRRGSPDQVRIVWADGVPQDLVQPAPDQVICEPRAE